MDLVEFMLAHGADVNKQDHQQWTVQCCNACCGTLEHRGFLLALPTYTAQVHRIEDTHVGGGTSMSYSTSTATEFLYT